MDAGFEFAFDNEAFSDRELRIVVVGANDAASRKRQREEAEGAYLQRHKYHYSLSGF